MSVAIPTGTIVHAPPSAAPTPIRSAPRKRLGFLSSLIAEAWLRLRARVDGQAVRS